MKLLIYWSIDKRVDTRRSDSFLASLIFYRIYEYINTYSIKRHTVIQYVIKCENGLFPIVRNI